MIFAKELGTDGVTIHYEKGQHFTWDVRFVDLSRGQSTEALHSIIVAKSLLWLCEEPDRDEMLTVLRKRLDGTFELDVHRGGGHYKHPPVDDIKALETIQTEMMNMKANDPL